MGGWSGELYREQPAATSMLLPTALVPYAFWGNRGPGEMSVWLPESREGE